MKRKKTHTLQSNITVECSADYANISVQRIEQLLAVRTKGRRGGSRAGGGEDNNTTPLHLRWGGGPSTYHDDGGIDSPSPWGLLDGVR